MIGSIFGVETDTWEERVAAVAFLSNVAFERGMFDEHVGTRMNLVVEKLGAMPPDWSRELALEALIGR